MWSAPSLRISRFSIDIYLDRRGGVVHERGSKGASFGERKNSKMKCAPEALPSRYSAEMVRCKMVIHHHRSSRPRFPSDLIMF